MGTILIVDDEQLIRWSLSQRLTEAGHATLEAADAAGALGHLAGRNGIDLVLLDLKLPDRDGLTVLREIKRRWPDCPVIMMTAYWASDAADEARHLGANSVVSKPFNMDGLLWHVQHALDATTHRSTRS